MQLLDRLHDQVGAQLAVVTPLVAPHRFQLLSFGRNQQLEHQPAPRFLQILRQPPQSFDLPRVHRRVAGRIVADQRLGEGRIERFEMPREIVVVFEVELVLAAFLGRRGRDEALGGRIAQDRRAELFVDQDASPIVRHAVGHGFEEAIVNDLLASGHVGGLLGRHRFVVAENFFAVGVAMIERQNV